MKWPFFNKTRKVSDTFRMYSIGLTLFAGIVFGTTFTIFQLNNFKESSELSKQYFVDLSKRTVKDQVNKVFDYIELTRSDLESHMRKNIQSRVNEAWAINNSLYEQNKDKLSKTEIKKLIKDAIRPLRFFDNRGYYFIASMKGVEELNAPRPHLEGQNLLDLKDFDGHYVIREQIKLINKQNEGFVTGLWAKPGEDPKKPYMKTSYVKYFEPLDWYIGTGEYLDNFEKDLKAEVIKQIKQIRFGEDGYIFVNTYDFVAVIIDSPIYKAGDTLNGIKDPNGIDIMEAEKRLAITPGGGYFEYSWPRTETDIIAPKISYVRGLDDWQWMIGAGVYTDDIDNLIAIKKKSLNHYLKIQIFIGFLLFLMVMVLVFIIANTISKRIQQNFETFTEKLRAGFWTGKILRNKDYNIKDFDPIINNINDLIISKLNAEELLSESETRFRTIFENAPVMILILDKNLNYITSNQEVQKSFDIDKSISHRKLNLKDLLTSEKQNKQLSSLFKKSDGKFKEFEIKTKDAIKTQNWAIFKTEFKEVIVVGYDITELKQSQIRSKELNDTKDKFFSIVSHDLKGPFNSILGFSELMVNEYSTFSDQERLKLLKQIHNSSSSMYQMLDNLLNWANSQTGIIRVNLTQFNLHSLVNNNINILTPQALNKEIKIENEIPHDLIVYADQSLTNTIIQNLVANSVKFTPNGGLIKLESEIIETHLKISVIDNGIGISKEVVDKVFTISTEKSQKGTHDEIGTGLGLVVCKEFVEKMDGDIWVESEVGKGTTFNFTLPLKKN